METISCNLCGESQTKPIMVVTDRKYHTPGKFSIVRCGGCGLAYLSPRPRTDEIGKFYPDTIAEHVATSAEFFTLEERKTVL